MQRAARFGGPKLLLADSTSRRPFRGQLSHSLGPATACAPGPPRCSLFRRHSDAPPRRPLRALPPRLGTSVPLRKHRNWAQLERTRPLLKTVIWRTGGRPLARVTPPARPIRQMGRSPRAERPLRGRATLHNQQHWRALLLAHLAGSVLRGCDSWGPTGGNNGKTGTRIACTGQTKCTCTNAFEALAPDAQPLRAAAPRPRRLAGAHLGAKLRLCSPSSTIYRQVIS